MSDHPAERSWIADRHLAAIARSLAWAQESAARGDYADALGWIHAVEATGAELSPAYQAKRLEWHGALADRLAKPRGT